MKVNNISRIPGRQCDTSKCSENGGMADPLVRVQEEGRVGGPAGSGSDTDSDQEAEGKPWPAAAERG